MGPGTSRSGVREAAVIAGRNAASTSRNARQLRRFRRLSSVKSGARGLDTRGVLDRPSTKRADGDQEIAAEAGELIIDPRRHRWRDRPADQSVPLQIAERERQHALGDAPNHPLDFVKPSGALPEPADD